MTEQKLNSRNLRIRTSEMLTAMIAVEMLRDDGKIRSREDIARPFLDDVSQKEKRMFVQLTNLSEAALRITFNQLYDEALEMLRRNGHKPYWLK